MNPRSTWFWLGAALALLALALLQGRLAHPPAATPTKVLAELRPAAVTALQVRHRDQEVIRAERTNSVWRLKPVDYPAQAVSVEGLLAALDRLAPAVYLSPHDLRSRPRAAEDEGLTQPRTAISIQQGDRSFQLEVGTNTPPGDQIYVQIAGDAGVYIVDAEFLKFLPQTKDDWRDRGLLDLREVAFDHVAVTNGPRVLELQRGPAHNPWQIVNPRLAPPARADAERIEGLLRQLEASRVAQFVADSPKAGLDAFGLQPPDLEIALARGTNVAVLLQFGKSATNDPALVYARRVGPDTIVTVPTNGLAAWRDSVNAFRDPHLVHLSAEPAEIDVRADERFSLVRQGSNAWKVVPGDLAADPAAVQELLAVLAGASIIDFKDLVTPADLAKDGLAPPYRQYVLRAAATAPATTNPVLAELRFGATNDNAVYVSRADETPVYAVRLADFQRLPAAGFQMRPRRLWQFAPEDVDRVLIDQGGKPRQVLHTGAEPTMWSLAPGSPGAIQALAVNETIRELGRLQVTNWVSRGEASRPRYGLKPAACQICVQLKNGDKSIVEIGAPPPGNSFYGAVIQGGEPWIFEFPAWLAQWIYTNLTVPP